jgi:hypothetical protein
LSTERKPKSNNPAPLIPKNWNVDTGYILFQSQDIFKQKSERTKELFNDLRALCIEYSPNGQPPLYRQQGQQDYGPESLENIKIIKEYVKKTYDSFIKDGCLPFIAIEDMFRNLKYEHTPFITKEALRRMAEIPIDKVNLRKYGQKEEKKKYEYQNIAKTISNLNKLEREFTYYAEFKPDRLIGFAKHENMKYKKAHYAVYADDLKDSDLEDHEIYKNKEISEVAKNIIDAFSVNLVHNSAASPDIYKMELDPLSMIQFLKRLLLLHHTKPMEKRTIYYSKSRKRILKIE